MNGNDRPTSETAARTAPRVQSKPVDAPATPLQRLELAIDAVASAYGPTQFDLAASIAHNRLAIHGVRLLPERRAA